MSLRADNECEKIDVIGGHHDKTEGQTPSIAEHQRAQDDHATIFFRA